MSRTYRHGFTFIEVLCLLMVVGVGLTGVIALVMYGVSISSQVRGATLGMSTAVSVAKDATPLLPSDMTADWTYTPYSDFDDTVAQQTSTARGYINGFYVERKETSEPSDIIRSSGSVGPVHIRSAHVSVEVYETIKGRPVASYTTRILRQRGRQ